jgi:hypothetical protein
MECCKLRAKVSCSTVPLTLGNAPLTRGPSKLRASKPSRLRVNRRAPKGFLVNNNWPTPYVFVSVASKGLSHTVSLLFATLAGRLLIWRTWAPQRGIPLGTSAQRSIPPGRQGPEGLRLSKAVCWRERLGVGYCSAGSNPNDKWRQASKGGRCRSVSLARGEGC